MWILNNILSFSYDGVKYGDIVYDTFLMQTQTSTIPHPTWRHFHIIKAIIVRHEYIKGIITSGSYKSVLVSHQVDLSSGVLLRTALRYGLNGYLRTGHHQSSLMVMKKPDDVYNYEYMPESADVEQVIDSRGSELNSTFKKIFERQVSGKGDADGMYAFSPQNKRYEDRISFNRDLNLSHEKKNIFVMLHALNDYPHSHFRWMIFKDFHDWMMETLSFAKSFCKVNWVFKQHPSIVLYPTRDISFKEVFSGLPDHIKYIHQDDQIDTRSLMTCADAVITCMGSAGFELPAMAGIPVIVASDNFYSHIGFVNAPETREDYFNTLKELHRIQKLTPEQQLNARATYIYIYSNSRVEMSACPVLNAENQKDPFQNNWYWQRVLALCQTQESEIKDEISRHIENIRQPNFSKLINQS